MQKNSLLAALPLVLTLAGASFALTSGPAMPEYNDFESVDNTDMVNLATGDFTYTVPVMTVPGPGLGFPIVLNYHGGIQPEQEATWVGLGWNLQAGAITRRVNNFPDDFKAVLIEEKFDGEHMQGWMASFSWNGVTVGISWDSEVGYGGMVGYSFSVGGEKSPFGVNMTAGVNGVYEGLGVSLTVSSGAKIAEGVGVGAGASIGLSTQGGVTAGVGGGISASQNKGEHVHTSASLASVGVSLSSKRGASAGASLGIGVSASTTTQGQVSQSQSGIWLPFWSPWTGYMELNAGNYDVYIDGLQEDRYYGFLYSDDAGSGCNPNQPETCYKKPGETYGDRCTACDANTTRAKKLDYNNAGDFMLSHGSNPKWFKVGSTGEDIYSVQTQGLSGTFKPYRTQDGDYYSYISNQDYNTQESCEGFTGDWFGATCDRRRTSNFGPSFESYRNHHTSGSPDKLVWRFNEETGGGLYTNPLQRESDPVLTTASKRIESIFSEGGSIIGWVLTASNGVRYLYTKPEYNYVQKNISSAESNLERGTRRETPAFAYAWLLTAILSPDYVQMGNNLRKCTSGEDVMGADVNVCLPRGDSLGLPGDLGGWVRFDYQEQGIVGWRAPLAGSEPTGYDMGNPVVAEGYSVSMGLKSVSYLSSISTPTHSADFLTAANSRSDNLPQPVADVGIQAEFERGGLSGEAEVCNYLGGPRTSSRYSHTIKVKKENLPPSTKVSILVNRHRVWDKYTCEFGFLSLTCGQFCRDGVREEFLQTVTLGDYAGTGDEYIIPVASSTRIDHVRVVIGEYAHISGALSLGYLRSVILKSKLFNKEVASVRFAYDYSLGQGTPNSESDLATNGGDQGRLTLLGVQIGASSQGPWNPPYRFAYGGQEIRYDRNKHDYWGDYCHTCVEKRRTPDGSADIWNLKKITTPAGSEMEIQYQPKTVDYVEGLPVIFDGDDIGDFFEIDDRTYSIKTQTPHPIASPSLPELPNDYLETEKNRNRIPREIADQFAGKYVSFLGSFDVPYPGKVTLGLLNAPGATKYIIETPKIYIENFIPPDLGDALEASIYNILSHGMWHDVRALYTYPGDNDYNPSLEQSLIESSRMNCVNSITGEIRTNLRNCRYYVGRTVTPNTPLEFGNYSLGCSFFNFGSENIPRYGMYSTGPSIEHRPSHPTWARMWAIYDTKPANFVKYGGGVRVSEVKFREPFGGKENLVRYKYSESATPTLPDPNSNYKLAIRLGAAEGLKAYAGNPGILHGKVEATFGTVPDAYSTEYHFVTSKDLPIGFESTSDYDGSNAQVDVRFKILDRSGLWGSLWKKVERDSDGEIVRSDVSLWANRIDQNWKDKLLKGSANLDVTVNDELVLKGEDSDIRIANTGTGLSPYFGVTQKLWGNRYIEKRCEDQTGTGKDGCVQGNQTVPPGVKTAQMEVLRFAPLVRRQELTQDGLVKTTEENLFDFQTGTPLLSIQSNVRPDNGVNYFATLKELAYHQSGAAYSGMRAKNMLDQEFSTTTFRFFNYLPVADDFVKNNLGELPPATLQNVVSSQFTAWRDYSPDNSKPQYRMEETFKLKDRGGFNMPTPASAGAQQWQSQGRNASYDEFGHVTEFENTAIKQKNAQIYAYGKSLPVAFASNSRRSELYYQSFETLEFQSEVKYGLGQSTESRSKTGVGALKLTNCLESPTGPSKPGCGASNSTLLCVDLPGLPSNNTYIASAWYYDEYQGSNPDNPMDPTYISKVTEVTRPGLFMGKETGAGCQVENHPNGAMVDPEHEVPPAGNTDPNAAQRALGGKNWKRIWSEFTPAPGCGTNGVLENAILCVYASKGKAGSDVIYDEIRVRPKKSLMSTFTYNHLGKMTSTADANEVTRHFDYDAFGTLKGIRNDDGLLLSEKFRKYHPTFFEPSFPDRDPIPYYIPGTNTTQQKCEAPEFRGKGDLDIDYNIAASSNMLVATIDPTGKKVCTQDYGGTSEISINFPALNKTVTIPINVRGSQIAMISYFCKDHSVLAADQITDDEVDRRMKAFSHCQFDYADLKGIATNRAKGAEPTGYGVTVELKRIIKRDPPDYGRLETVPWLCVDGVHESGCGSLEYKHAHLRFSGFQIPYQNQVYSQARTIVPNAFPDPETEDRFMGLMKTGPARYLIISNRKKTFTQYAPTLFLLDNQFEPSVTPIRLSKYAPFDIGLGTSGSLKMEFGMPPQGNTQFDFEAAACSPGSVDHPYYKRMVDIQAQQNMTIKNKWILTTVRAYVKN